MAGQPPQQALESGGLEAALLLSRRILQGLQAVEYQQRALLCHQLRQPLALVPGRAFVRIRVVEPPQGVGDEQVGGRLPALGGALAVERPSIHALGAAIAVPAHPAQPYVDPVL